MPTARLNYWEAPQQSVGPFALDDAPVDLKKSVKRRKQTMTYRYQHCHINFEADFDCDMDLERIFAVSYVAADRDDRGIYPVRMFSDYDLQESVGNMEMVRAQDPQVLIEMRKSAERQWAEDERSVA